MVILFAQSNRPTTIIEIKLAPKVRQSIAWGDSPMITKMRQSIAWGNSPMIIRVCNKILII